MKGLILKAKDQLRLEVVAKIESGRMTRKEGSFLLQVSERTLRRYIKHYREKGISFLQHGNCRRKPANKSSDTLKTQAQRLMKDKYFDFNMSHALEKVNEELGVKIRRETFRKWCHEIHLVKRSKKRRSHPRYYRSRMPQPGTLIQMDGSHHRWFDNIESCLIAAIDDATGEVVGAEFFESETTLGSLKVLNDIVATKGVFKTLYVDKAGIFGGNKRQNFSQVDRALSEVGSHIIYAHSPEAKGRIERLFNTLQDRLVAEMRLNKIRTMTDANRFLKQVYIPRMHNPKFMVQAHNPTSAYVKLRAEVDLENIFCIKEHRLINNDHTISLGGEKYMIADELKYSIKGHRLELRFKQGKWQAYFADQPVKIVKVQQATKIKAS